MSQNEWLVRILRYLDSVLIHTSQNDWLVRVLFYLDTVLKHTSMNGWLVSFVVLSYCFWVFEVYLKCFERLVKSFITSSLPDSLDPLQFAYRSTDDAIALTLHTECCSLTTFQHSTPLCPPSSLWSSGTSGSTPPFMTGSWASWRADPRQCG